MTPEITSILLLALILVLAHLVETTLGFGDTIISLAFGLFLFPLEVLLPALVALAILQSTWLVIRWHRQRQLAPAADYYTAAGLCGDAGRNIDT